MELFAKNKNKVIFVEHLGFERQKIKNIPNIIKKIAKAISQRLKTTTQAQENITIITSIALPPTNRIFNLLNELVFLKFLTTKLAKLYDKKPIIWTYTATSTALNIIKKLKPELVIYDCVCDTLRHPEAPFDIETTEKELLKSADLVFTDARYFYELKKKYNPHTYQIPPGVDFEHFNVTAVSDKNVLSIMDRIKRPRICSFTGIDRNRIRVDLDLIDFIADKKPEWSIIMIGPMHIKIPKQLSCRKNVIWLGTKSYAELPHYLNQCDVLILPYKLNEYTQSIFPAKTFECLATGKPVVSTALPELNIFKDLIAIANNPSDFIKGIENALLNDTSIDRDKRITFARENPWDKRFKTVYEKIESALCEKERKK